MEYCMATEHAQSSLKDSLAHLDSYQYIQLTTFRKNGKGVSTVVWFAVDTSNGKLYVTTNKDTGKIKRIHQNGRVTVAPCDRFGKHLGVAVHAHARELPTEDFARARAALQRKYGLTLRVFSFLVDRRKAARTFIEIDYRE
jgi:PPOX class probable F420-dependent enzyme